MWVARIVVLPIQRLATLLSEWSPGSPRTIGGRPDEQSLLLLAFDQAQRRVDEALSRERGLRRTCGTKSGRRSLP